MRRNSKDWPAVRGVLAGVLTGALLATGLGTPALAAAPVSVDQNALASQLFGGLAEVRFDGDKSFVEAATVSADFLEWRRLHPLATLGESQAELAAEKQLLVNGLTAVDVQQDEPAQMMRAIDLLSAAGGSPARSSSHVRDIARGLAGSSVGPLDSREDLSEGALSSLSWQRARPDILSSLWADVRLAAHDDPVFAQTWNSVLGTPATLDVTASVAQLKAAEELRGKVDIDKILSLADSPDAFSAEARGQVDAVFAGLTTLAGNVNQEAATQASNCPAQTPVVSPKCTEENNQKAAQKDKENQSEADKFKAALDVLDPLLKKVDSGFANQVKVVGEAIITTVKAISKYADDISKIVGVSSKIFSLATATMTGNIFGAVMSVAGLFGSSKPDVSKQILDQVKALQGQVKDLQKAMTAGFARIDTKLNNIYNTMVAEFDKLNAAIAGNAAQLQLLQQNVAQLGLRLEEVTASILSAIGQAELVNVRTSIDKYIGYAEQFGTPIPAFTPDYIGAETDLHLASTQLADDGAFVVPAADADNPALDPTTVLNSNGETRAINYLARYASKRDAAIASSTAPVGNAGVWGLGAQGYTLLQLQNPAYARQVASSRANDIEISGQRILDLAASFSHPAATPDANGSYRNPLFKSLDADYRTGVQNLSSALRTIRTADVLSRFEPTTDGVQIKTSKNYDLFWNGTSAPAPVPPVPGDSANISHCTGTQQITRPSNVSFGGLPTPVKFINYAFTPRNTEPPAGVRELPEVSICEVPTWSNLNTTEDPDGGVIRTSGQLRLDVYTRYRLNPNAAWQNAVDTSYTWPDRITFDSLCTTTHCHAHLNPEVQLDKIWATPGRSDFQSRATTTVDSVVVAAATTAVQQFLTSRQKFLYDSVANALSSPSTPTAAAVKQMNTARRLLQAYTQLGLPVAAQSDELLTALLSGQFKLLGDLSTEPTITDAVHTASNNYGCGTTCTVDPLRPVQNQTFFEPTDAPCATSAAGPGDPLGNCLVEHALRRVGNVGARLDIHFKQLANADYTERLPSVATTLDELKISDRLSHSAAVTAGAGQPSNTIGQDVSLDLNQYTSGGKAPYTYTATGLPAGLTLASTGVIHGSPTTNGTSTVTVTALDAAGVSGNVYSFKWAIGVVGVPDLKGLDWNLAMTAITQAGLSVGSRASKLDCTKPFGTVDSQTPAANTGVSPGTTPVNVVYTTCSDQAPKMGASSQSTNGHVAVTWTDRSTSEDSFVVSRYTTRGVFVSQAVDQISRTRQSTGAVLTFTDDTPDANAPCYVAEAHIGGNDIVLKSGTSSDLVKCFFIVH